MYVGLGLWRQLAAGTDGAYQLFANLISRANCPEVLRVPRQNRNSPETHPPAHRCGIL